MIKGNNHNNFNIGLLNYANSSQKCTLYLTINLSLLFQRAFKDLVHNDGHKYDNAIIQVTVMNSTISFGNEFCETMCFIYDDDEEVTKS